MNSIQIRYQIKLKAKDTFTENLIKLTGFVNNSLNCANSKPNSSHVFSLEVPLNAAAVCRQVLF